MIRNVLILLPVTLLLLLPSCRKKEKEPKRSLAIGVPYDNDSLMPPVNSLIYPPDVTIKNVWGVFIANNQTRIIKDTSGVYKKYDYTWQQAIFLNYAGQVKLNDSALTPLSPTSWWSNNPELWNRNGSNTWSAAGNNNNMPVIHEVTSAKWPVFSGSFRDTLDRDGLSYKFDETNTDNADSAYIILYAPKSAQVWYSKIVSAKGGIAAFNIYAPRTFAVNGYFGVRDQLCYGVLLEVVLLNYDIRTIDGKSFAFVRQKQVLFSKRFYQ